MNTATSLSASITAYTQDVLLRDGALLRMRALRRDDRAAIEALFQRCSPDSIRFRFLFSLKALSTELLNQLTDVNNTSRVALAVLHGNGTEEHIVAVGRYFTMEKRPHVAEVSFLVEDAWQRRGLGSRLLDALADIARKHGITRFAADVLADNRTMLSVFRKAGYALSATASYGVTHLEFPIAPNEIAAARQAAQEAEAERAALQAVLAPCSIAVIGASRNRRSPGGALFHNLLRWGFQGTVYPVNPNAHAVAGVRAYPDISALPERPELAFIAVPAGCVLEAARQCAAAGVRALCVISAGFSESGTEGKKQQAELLSICRGAGMRMVGPNCMGIVNSSNEVRMLGTFAPTDPPAGNIAISSQSGALGLALLNQAGELGLGVSSFVSTGNKADVSGNDLLQWWEADDATEVVLLYLESFGNPRRFAPIARRVARRKPIVAVKAGRSVAGARAAASHTAALASSDAAADALFAQTGIIRVNTLADFFAVARLLATQPIPTGKRVAILTNAGGPAILAVDAAEAAGLEIPTLSEATQTRLRAALPPTAAVNNPVDMIASAGPDAYRVCLEALCDEPDLDALIVIFIPPLVTPSADVAQVISEVIAARPNLQRTVTAVFLDPAAKLNAIHAGERIVPVYDFPEGAVAALSAAARYGVWRATPLGHRVDVPLQRETIDDVLAKNSAGWLSSSEAARLLNAAGINVIAPQLAHSPAEAAAIAQKFNAPVVLKIAEPATLHKSDVGGVVLNLAPAEAAAGYEQLAQQVASHGITLQAAHVMPMAKPGVEVIAGITHDAVFGPLVAFGSGGVLVELLHDIAFRVLPMTDQDAATMIRETRAASLLQGFRGAPPADVAALGQLLLALGALAEAVPRVAEVDLNPVLVHPAGSGLSLIDARVRLT